MKSPALFLAFAATMILTPALAQTDMQWDSWGLAFTLPNGMQVVENDGEIFSAESDDLFVSILPVADSWAGEEELAEAVLTMMESLEFDRVTDADEMEMNDLYGYYIEGKKNNLRVVVMALMDRESDRNFLVNLIFKPAARDKAIRLARSLYAYDE